MPKAGYCSQCGRNSWLNESGGCVAGHGPECITGAYEVGAGPPVTPAPMTVPATPASKRPVWIIVLVVVAVLLLMLCGCLTAIAIPMFNGAKTDALKKSCLANMRVVEGGEMVYLAEHEGAKPPADWSELMSRLVPGIIKTPPVCPSGGTYSWVPEPASEAGGHVECSIHGSLKAPR